MKSRGASYAILFFMVGWALSGCTKYAFDEPEEEKRTGEIKVVHPIASGRGTQLRPLSVSQVLSGMEPERTSGAWVMGYAVGATRQSMSNATFDASTDIVRNVLLSDDSLCTNTDSCIAIEFTTTSFQKQFSLMEHPEKHRQALVVCGQWGIYFNRRGLRSVSAGYWLPGFDFSTLSFSASWLEENFTY